ncbi:MAG: hypothetical protein Q7R40_03060 [Phaeospirillum sp.]|nr:hypothetical protein [Phaeospirillum sp.]
MISIALIDCENLASTVQRAAACRWVGFDRVELFGRAPLVAPWRDLLTVAAEIIIADDAPSQAADQAMARRVDHLIAQPAPPRLVVIASNDKGFDADIARLGRAGVKAERQGDLTVPQTLALVVVQLAGNGWVAAGGVGDHLRRRFGIALHGRVEALAKAAGLELRHTPAGPMIRTHLGVVGRDCGRAARAAKAKASGGPPLGD